MLHHAAATVAVQTDAREVLAKLANDGAPLAESQPVNASISEIAALILV